MTDSVNIEYVHNQQPYIMHPYLVLFKCLVRTVNHSVNGDSTMST